MSFKIIAEFPIELEKSPRVEIDFRIENQSRVSGL